MQLIASRTYPLPDGTAPQERCAREVLFRGLNGDFILYVSARGALASAEDRVLRLDTRNALIWINEDADRRNFVWPSADPAGPNETGAT